METINMVINNIISYLESVGLVGGFFLVLLEAIFPILPLSVFIGMNILAFGNILGFIISYFASITGCFIAFLLSKHILKNFIYKFFKEKTKKKIEQLMLKFSNIDLTTLVVIHALPFTPSFLTNIAAGLSNMNNRKYLLSLFIGKLVIIYFWGYIGSNILEAFKNPILLIRVVVLVLVAYLVSKAIAKIIKVEE